MKIMGLSNWLHWTAWFCKTFVLIFVTIILMVVLLKVSWYPGTDFTVFTYTDPFLLFFFLICYACATITFCFAVSVFFSKGKRFIRKSMKLFQISLVILANTATTVAGVVWFLTYVIYAMVQNQYNTTSLAQKMLISLAINSGMAYGFQLILMWEGTGKGKAKSSTNIGDVKYYFSKVWDGRISLHLLVLTMTLLLAM